MYDFKSNTTKMNEVGQTMIYLLRFIQMQSYIICKTNDTNKLTANQIVENIENELKKIKCDIEYLKEHNI